MDCLFAVTRDYVEGLLQVPVKKLNNNSQAWRAALADRLPEFCAAGIDWDNFSGAPIREKTIYLLEIGYRIRFVFCLLAKEEKLLLFGPYLTSAPDEAFCVQALEENHASLSLLAPLRLYYNSLPVCANSALISAAQIFISHCYEKTIATTVKELSPARHLPPEGPADGDALRMRQLERRYELENRLLLEVEQGNPDGAVRLYQSLELEINRLARVSDPIRNQKNLGVILNTLLRKTAEHARVHPVYIDALSSNFAYFIEGENTLPGLLELMRTMVAAYSSLVSKHALRSYSPIVRKAIDYIHVHLGSPLCLQEIARASKVSSNYLSALFHEETGHTLPAYINQKRVTKAAELLETTDSPISDIAFYVGFSDLNYCSKVFKRLTGLSPSEYRRRQRPGKNN